MPGAERVEGTPLGAAPQGGAPRTVWLTTESDPGLLSARAAALRLQEQGRTAHLVWNPVTGETAQLLPTTSAANGALTDRGVDHAAEGRVCILILVIGRTLAPFTDGPLTGLADILTWLDSWEVARQWPAGAPAAPSERALWSSSRERIWARGGHFGHCQVPGAHSDSPGAISPERILGAPHAVAAPTPPRPPEPRRGGGHPQRDVCEHDIMDPPGGVGSSGLDTRPRVGALPS
ncbi:hypothetical protein F4561_000973 [Lipingzhangella halophila]|uniref:Uncharacterized protein n=1 Tax=Lipingzhangella halophila TaxID=1783352 RepID=A0A7W7RDU0_9ACTN|nr:hypothetical protein [Lipingzhangella halophila]MBB4930153.1 hypothetical protein [Lipingzhangella halophila]